MMPARTISGLLILIAVGCLAVGCGDPGPVLHAVSGQVLYQGRPLPLGNVMFIPHTGPAATSTIAPDGSYSLQAATGEHHVIVTAIQSPSEGVIDEQSYNPPPPLIPARFGQAETSGLAVTVVSGKNSIDLKLQ